MGKERVRVSVRVRYGLCKGRVWQGLDKVMVR